MLVLSEWAAKAAELLIVSLSGCLPKKGGKPKLKKSAPNGSLRGFR